MSKFEDDMVRLELTADRMGWFLTQLQEREALPAILIGMHVGGPDDGMALCLACDMPNALVITALRRIADSLERGAPVLKVNRHPEAG